MSLDIKESLADELPSTVKTALSKLDTSEQQQFEEDYSRKRRSPVTMLLLAILIPVQHFVEGKIALGIVFWLTLGAMGIWYVIDIIMIWSRTKRHNEELSKSILRDMKIMNS